MLNSIIKKTQDLVSLRHNGTDSHAWRGELFKKKPQTKNHNDTLPLLILITLLKIIDAFLYSLHLL